MPAKASSACPSWMPLNLDVLSCMPAIVAAGEACSPCAWGAACTSQPISKELPDQALLGNGAAAAASAQAAMTDALAAAQSVASSSGGCGSGGEGLAYAAAASGYASAAAGSLAAITCLPSIGGASGVAATPCVRGFAQGRQHCTICNVPGLC